MNMNLIHKSPRTKEDGRWVYTGGDIFIINSEPYVLSYVDSNFDSVLVCLYDGMVFEQDRIKMRRDMFSLNVWIDHDDFVDYMYNAGCGDWYYFGRFEDKWFWIEEIGEWE